MLSGGSLLDLCLQDELEHRHGPRCSLRHMITGSDLPRADLCLIGIEGIIAPTIIFPQAECTILRFRDPAAPLRASLTARPDPFYPAFKYPLGRILTGYLSCNLMATRPQGRHRIPCVRS